LPRLNLLAGIRRRGAVSLVAVAALAATAAPAALADEDEGTPDITQQTVLSSVDFGTPIVTSRSRIDISASATLGEDVGTDPVHVVLRVTEEPLKGSRATQQWMEGTLQPATSQEGRSVPLVASPGNEESAIPTFVNARVSALGLPEGESGVYGIEVALVGTEEYARERSVVVWHDSEVGTYAIAAAAVASGSSSRAQIIAGAAQANGVTILADTAALNSDGTTENTTWAPEYALPRGNLDIASVVRGGHAEVLDRALALSDITTGEDGGGWAALLPSTDPALIEAVEARGASLIVVTEDSRLGTPTASVTSENTPVLTSAPLLSRLITEAGPTDTATHAWAVAESFFLATDSPQTRMLLLDSRWRVDSDSYASEALSAVFAAPWTRRTDTTRLIAAASGAAPEKSEELLSDLSRTELTAAVDALDTALAVAASSSDPAGVRGDSEERLLRALAHEGRSDPALRESQVETATRELEEIIASVAIASVATLNLISSESDLPVTVRNDLDADVTIRVRITSRDPHLIVEDTPELLIPAQSQTQVGVRVSAVGSADVNARVALTTTEGVTIGEPTVVRVRVRAALGDTLTWLLAGGFALLFVAGVIRTIRRGQAATRGSSSSPQGGA